MNLNLALRALVGMLLRRAGLIVFLFLSLFGAAAAWILLAPPQYRGESTLLATFGREHTLRSYGEGDRLVPVNYAQDQIVNSVVEILRSDVIATNVIEELGYETIYPTIREESGREGLIARLTPTLWSWAAALPDSWRSRIPRPQQGIEPGADARDPERAAAERLRRNVRVNAAGRSNVIAARFTHTEPEVAALVINSYVRMFQDIYRDLYGEDLVPLLEADVTRAQEQLTAAQNRVEAFESERFTFEGDGIVERLLLRKSDLQRQWASLEECCLGTAAVGALEREIEQLNATILANNADRAQLRDLIRERERAEVQLTSARDRRQDALNMRSLEVGGLSSVRVISLAEPPTNPPAPGRALRLAIVFVFAAIFSLAAGLSIELVVRRYSLPDELQAAFGVPVLANIPHVRTRRG